MDSKEAKDLIGLMGQLNKTIKNLAASIDKMTSSQRGFNGSVDEMNEKLEESSNTQDKISGKIDESERRQRNLNKSMGLFGNTLKASEKVLGKIGLGGTRVADALGKATKKGEDLAHKLTDGGKAALGLAGKLRVAATMAKTLAAAMPGAVFGMILGLVNKIKEGFEKGQEAAKKISDQNVGMARSLGIAQGAANKLAGAARGIGAGMGITNAQAVESATAIQGALETTEKLGGKTLNTFMRLNVFAGYSADTLGEFQKMAKVSGQDAGEMVERFADQVVELKKVNKSALSIKVVMETVAKAGYHARIQFGGQKDALVKAAFTAKQMGMEIDEMVAATKSLLNIEDSIEAEMEAQLLTGKDINLSKARELALNGKSDEAMKEVMNQMGGQEEFAKLNVIQQESLAKAAGLSLDQFSKAMVTQKEQANIQGDLVEGHKDGLKAQQSGASLSEQLQRRAEGLEAAWSSVYSAFKPFVDALRELQSYIMPKISQLLAAFSGAIPMDAVGSFVDKFKEMGDKIFPIILGAVQTLSSLLKPIIGFALKLGEYLITYVYDIFKKIEAPVKELGGKLQEMGKALLPAIQGALDNIKPIFEFIAQKVIWLVGGIADLVTNLTDANKELTGFQKIIVAIAGVYLTIKGFQMAQKGYQAIVTAIETFKENALKKNEVLIKGLNKLTGDKFKLEEKINKSKTKQNQQEKTLTNQKKAEGKVNGSLMKQEDKLKKALDDKIKKQKNLNKLKQQENKTNGQINKSENALSRTMKGREKIASTIVKTKKAEGKQISANSKKEKGNMFKSIASASPKIVGSLSAIPVAGPALGAAAVLAMVAAAQGYLGGGETADDLLSPASNKGGYGDRVLLSPEGTFSFNNRDTILAGTDLTPVNDFSSAPAGTVSGDVKSAIEKQKELIAEVKRTNQLLGQILGKEGKVTMDGNKVGTSVGMSTSRLR